MLAVMLLQLVCLSQSWSCHPLSMQQTKSARIHSRVLIGQQWRCMPLQTGQSSLGEPHGREWHWDWGQGFLQGRTPADSKVLSKFAIKYTWTINELHLPLNLCVTQSHPLHRIRFHHYTCIPDLISSAGVNKKWACYLIPLATCLGKHAAIQEYTLGAKFLPYHIFCTLQHVWYLYLVEVWGIILVPRSHMNRHFINCVPYFFNQMPQLLFLSLPTFVWLLFECSAYSKKYSIC